MNLPPFLLDQWLEQKFSANPPIEFDLGSSTGPVWTLRELLSLGGDIDHLLETKLFYTPPAGSVELREELARMSGVEPESVLVMTGASEALLVLFHMAAEPGANVVLPNPGFPTNAAVAGSLGLEVRHYTLRAENNFQIDLHEIRQLVDRSTKLVLVNSPNNPTGAVLSDPLKCKYHYTITALSVACSSSATRSITRSITVAKCVRRLPSRRDGHRRFFRRLPLSERPANRLDDRARRRAAASGISTRAVTSPFRARHSANT